jgi:hypothetical protein
MQTVVLKNAFYRAGQGALGMSLWNRGAVTRKSFETTVLTSRKVI